MILRVQISENLKRISDCPADQGSGHEQSLRAGGEEDYALEQCLSKAGLASRRSHVREVGTRVMAEQKGARLKAARSNQASAGRHDQGFGSQRQKWGPGIGQVRTRA